MKPSRRTSNSFDDVRGILDEHHERLERLEGSPSGTRFQETWSVSEKNLKVQLVSTLEDLERVQRERGEALARAEKHAEAYQEIKAHTDNVIGALTDAETIPCGTYDAMADGVRQLTRERNIAVEGECEALERAKKAEADWQELSALMYQRENEAQAAERRANDYKKRFEALRRDVEELAIRQPHGSPCSRILGRHPGPEGKAAPAKPGPQYPQATCKRCSGCGYTVQPSYSEEWEHDCPVCMKPRPPYVPESAPFCWSVDGLGDEVGMWVEGNCVRIYDPGFLDEPWIWSIHGTPREDWPNGTRRLSVRLWDDADGLWRKVRGE